MEDNSQPETPTEDNLQEPSSDVENSQEAQEDNLPEWQTKFKTPDEMYASYHALEEKLGTQGNEVGEMRQMLKTFVETNQAPQPQQRDYDYDPKFNNPDSKAALEYIDKKFGISGVKTQVEDLQQKLSFALDKVNFREFKERHPDLTPEQHQALWEIGGRYGGIPDYEEIYTKILKPAIQQATTNAKETVETKKRAKGIPQKAGAKGGDTLDIGSMSIKEYAQQRDRILNEYKNLNSQE